MLPAIQVPTVLRNLANVLFLVGQRISIRTKDRYWGVQIVPPDSGAWCESARRLQGQRFPTDKAPLLPLWDCTMAQNCHCRYRHLSERRSDQSPCGRIFLELDGPDRRTNDDRYL